MAAVTIHAARRGQAVPGSVALPAVRAPAALRPLEDGRPWGVA
jgi:hypothetical protein